MNCFKNQVNYLLTYPRSGQHWLTHMLRCIKVNVYISHEIFFYKEWPPKPSDCLFTVVRDYKECIFRHLYWQHDTITRQMIDKAFGSNHAKPYRAQQYIENLVMFDVYPNKHKKVIIYYEDMLARGKEALASCFMRFLMAHQHKLLEELDWEKESQEALDNYSSPKLSNGQLHYHVNKAQKDDVEYFRHMIYKLNPYIYDKYLKRYDHN